MNSDTLIATIAVLLFLLLVKWMDFLRKGDE